MNEETRSSNSNGHLIVRALHQDEIMNDLVSQCLSRTGFSAADCEAALGGLALPENLGNAVVRLCVVAGIRRHILYAKSNAISALCMQDGHEVFARARNARLIMSDEVPSAAQMPTKTSYPYCIWYPDVASEETYRRLALTFPELRYQVGRACAVAGYVQLYRELDLLPDACIAEEARESKYGGAGSRQIFEDIMAMPTRYNVMDDYHVIVQLDTPRPGAMLNADTAVRAGLEARKQFRKNFAPSSYFNITEDWAIDVDTVTLPPARLADEEAALLMSPLPFDLPTMHKDLLILVSAYEGQLDRYVRLRRPQRSIEYELHCLVPGVYKSTAMALWLERNPSIMKTIAAVWDEGEIGMLKRAIHARHIMNNDTKRLLEASPAVPDDELPYWIWYPTIPSAYTLYTLAEARPAMRPQCVRACIAGGHRWAYTKIMDIATATDPTPLVADPCIALEAKASLEHSFFMTDLERRQEQSGLTVPRVHAERWKMFLPWRHGDKSSTTLYGDLVDDASCIVHIGQDWGMWEGLGADLGRVRLHASSLPETRARARETGSVIMEDHGLQR